MRARYRAISGGAQRQLPLRLAEDIRRDRDSSRRPAGIAPGIPPAARRAKWRPRRVSSGSRSDSSTARLNSGNSSRNNTPRCARLTSPGRACGPPPMMALAEARVVRRAKRPLPVVRARRSRACSPRRWRRHRALRCPSSGGSRPGRRCASMLLPVPGGPTSSRLCPPAAAMISARLAAACPRTSARSEPGSVHEIRGTRSRGAGVGLTAARALRTARRRLTKCPAPCDAPGAASRASRELRVRHDHAARPSRAACAAASNTPRMGLSSPASPSSP